jgi:hypothetical protein
MGICIRDAIAPDLTRAGLRLILPGDTDCPADS